MLLARVVTAVVAIIAILVVLFVLPPDIGKAVIALVVAAAAWEWSAFLRIESTAIRLAYVVLVVACCALTLPSIALLTPNALLMIAGLWWVTALILVLRYPVRVSKAMTFVAGFTTLVPTFFALLALARYPETGNITGPALLLFVLVVIWGADVGGYFAGRFLGKRKLSPAVSPNKTWAGVVGGLVVSGLVGVIGSVLFELAWFRLVPLCILTAAVSVLGDLTVSMFKREADVKDSGVLFPGHGGVLDRLDSIAAAAPFFVAGIVAGHGAW
ncbi:MAG: phosphatidate cytidylyltransferase [Pseudomonadota bacterium]